MNLEVAPGFRVNTHLTPAPDQEDHCVRLSAEWALLPSGSPVPCMHHRGQPLILPGWPVASESKMIFLRFSSTDRIGPTSAAIRRVP